MGAERLSGPPYSSAMQALALCAGTVAGANDGVVVP